jgi:hypothetical protein
MDHSTIFITIPAYEDPQLLQTLDGALANALYPERLFFCIGMQYRTLPDISKYLDNPNFNFIFYDVDTRPGVYQIRKEMADQHLGQDYFLMIDSHMIFHKYWDALLVNDYKNLVALHGDRVVMSKPVTNKLGLNLDNEHVNDMPYWKVRNDLSPKEINRFLTPAVKNIQWFGEGFMKSYYACNHFFFTNKKFLSEIGFFDGIRFYCEELITSILLYISGWDIYFNPVQTVIGHDDRQTIMHIYGLSSYSLADGKPFTAIEDSDLVKDDIANFVLTGRSEIIKANLVRSVEDYYRLCGLEDIHLLLKQENL